MPFTLFRTSELKPPGVQLGMAVGAGVQYCEGYADCRMVQHRIHKRSDAFADLLKHAATGYKQDWAVPVQQLSAVQGPTCLQPGLPHLVQLQMQL